LKKFKLEKTIDLREENCQLFDKGLKFAIIKIRYSIGSTHTYGKNPVYLRRNQNKTTIKTGQMNSKFYYFEFIGW